MNKAKIAPRVNFWGFKGSNFCAEDEILRHASTCGFICFKENQRGRHVDFVVGDVEWVISSKDRFYTHEIIIQGQIPPFFLGF